MTYGPIQVAVPSDAIVLAVGANYKAIIDSAPAGSTFVFTSGTHRLTEALDPKDGQTFIGSPGAVLNGSHVLTNIGQEGSLYVAGGQTQEGERRATDMGVDGAPRAGYPETLFVDGHPLKAVASIADVKAGTFYFDYAADKMYFADNPAGHTVEAGVAAGAFVSNAANVTISNLVIEKFDSPTQHGAIQGGQNWTVTNNEVRLNYGVGITVQAGSHVVGNDVHDNGQMGIGGSGANILVQGNEIASNGAWSGIDPFWEGGGTKFAETTNLIVRDNYSHDNHGFGLWTDINNVGTLYEGNTLVHNDGGGINHEISYDAVIRNNTFVGNGTVPQGANWLWGAAIQIQNSQNVDIYGNKIDMSGGLNGIALIQQNRGTGTHGDYTTTGNTIHDNLVVSTSGNGLIGGGADYNEAGLLNGGNVFSNNRYVMDGGNHWRWGDFPSGDDWRAYQADTHQDVGSVVTQTGVNTASWLTGLGAAPSTPVVTVPGGGVTIPHPTTGAPATPAPAPADGANILGTAGDDVLHGKAGSAEVHGLAGHDTIHAGPGNELLYGGADSDKFVFADNRSHASIEDFTLTGPAKDQIMLPAQFFTDFSHVVEHAQNVGNDAVIHFGTTQVALNDITVAELHADLFTFA